MKQNFQNELFVLSALTLFINSICMDTDKNDKETEEFVNSVLDLANYSETEKSRAENSAGELNKAEKVQTEIYGNVSSESPSESSEEMVTLYECDHCKQIHYTINNIKKHVNKHALQDKKTSLVHLTATFHVRSLNKSVFIQMQQNFFKANPDKS